MSCPNCGSYGSCYCTWSEIEQAMKILRRQEAEFRRQIGAPTVVEREAERLRRTGEPVQTPLKRKASHP